MLLQRAEKQKQVILCFCSRRNDKNGCFYVIAVGGKAKTTDLEVSLAAVTIFEESHRLMTKKKLFKSNLFCSFI